MPPTRVFLINRPGRQPHSSGVPPLGAILEAARRQTARFSGEAQVTDCRVRAELATSPSVLLAMPLFYFDVHDGEAKPDRTGTEYDGIEQAREEATRMAGDLIRECGAWRNDGYRWKLEVCDEVGIPVICLGLLSSHGRLVADFSTGFEPGRYTP